MASSAVGELRATASEEKEVRRQQILEAAAELFRSWSFADITMDRIADLAGVAKGTLYLYFRTKEALFLSLFEQQLSTWYSELEVLSSRVGGTVKPAAAAHVIASTLSARPILSRLHGLLHSALGLNIDLDSVLDFRRRQRRRITSLSPVLASRIDGLSEPAAVRFLIRLETVIGGLSWAAFPTPALARALEEEDLAVFRLDFEKELREMITALLQ